MANATLRGSSSPAARVLREPDNQAAGLRDAVSVVGCYQH
jgi:hypothetical protein